MVLNHTHTVHTTHNLQSVKACRPSPPACVTFTAWIGTKSGLSCQSNAKWKKNSFRSKSFILKIHSVLLLAVCFYLRYGWAISLRAGVNTTRVRSKTSLNPNGAVCKSKLRAKYIFHTGLLLFTVSIIVWSSLLTKHLQHWTYNYITSDFMIARVTTQVFFSFLRLSQ